MPGCIKLEQLIQLTCVIFSGLLEILTLQIESGTKHPERVQMLLILFLGQLQEQLPHDILHLILFFFLGFPLELSRLLVQALPEEYRWSSKAI